MAKRTISQSESESELQKPPVLVRRIALPPELNYYIISHGTETLKSIDSIGNVYHLVSNGLVYPTYVLKNGQCIIPIIHDLCGKRISTDNPIDKEIKLYSDEATKDFAGVYVCAGGEIIKIFYFKNHHADVKIEEDDYNKGIYNLSDVVKVIKEYHDENYGSRKYSVGVVTCRSGNSDTYFPGYHPTNSYPECTDNSVDIHFWIKMIPKKGGKSRKRRKRSRKKMLHTYHRRR